jgi:succinate-semialdehyde dehydrogenase/glutarate-semialdehyde dehydrogenase
MQLKDPTLLRQQCFVGGTWVGELETDVTDPATGAVIARVPYFGAAETRDAIESANAAFARWAKLTGKARANLIMTTEQGKPLAEAIGEMGDLDR